MQRLVFTNSNGVSIDLTKEPYGITKWTGFANANLNIQSQQVPFHDGSVFLDALINDRNLSVTLAMNDGNDLEKRYELRRELISILNPKLGEGVLVYTNDFISKQIKCIPKIPLFDTHNSNTKGTPKASLAWTACDPYWEDTEETVVFLKNSIRTLVENKGDVPCQIKVELFTNNVVNPFIKNFNQNKKIGLDGTFEEGIEIDTNFGNKKIIEKKLDFNNIAKLGMDLNSVTCSDYLGLFVTVGSNGTILTSQDGVNWKKEKFNSNINLKSVTYSTLLGLFVIVGESGTILTSPDGVDWESVENDFSMNLNKCYSFNDLVMVVGESGTILTSQDGVNWESQTSGTSANLNSITYSPSLDLIVIVGASGIILTSSDGVNWESQTSGTSLDIKDITYSNSLNLFVAITTQYAYRLDSSDGVNWNLQNSGIAITNNLHTILFSETLNLFMIFGNSSIAFYISYDGKHWESKSLGDTIPNIRSSVYSKSLGMFSVVGDMGCIGFSFDGSHFSLLQRGQNVALNYVTRIDEKDLFFIGGNSGNVNYLGSDGKKWEIKRIYSSSSGSTTIIYSVIYIKKLNLFFAAGKCGSSGIVFTSSDGQTWTQIYFLNTPVSCFYSIIYSEKLNLIIAATNHGIYTSQDGINWTNRYQTNLGFYSITYSEISDVFIAVGDNSEIVKSSNGINWVRYANFLLTFNVNLKSIAYSKSLNLFVIVGEDGTILTSPNGENWVERASEIDKNLNSIIYSEKIGMFVTVGIDGTILTSSDGINWKKRIFDSLINLNSVAYSEKLNLFVIVGDPETIFYSNLSDGDNLMDKISQDSEMNLSLNVEDNVLILSCNSGNINAKLTYRQKYLGV